MAGRYRQALFLPGMSKIKTAFFCTECGYESAKWLGRCPSCQAWNSFTQEVIQKPGKATAPTAWADGPTPGQTKKAIAISQVQAHEEARLVTPDAELNRVLGGGIVPGSVVLIAGEPGIGKSTLFLQAGLKQTSVRVLYISGEESLQQVKMRADRLGAIHPEFYLLTETNVQQIFAEIKKLQPNWVIVDSIQTLESSLIDSPAGGIAQIKECAAELQRYAKDSCTPVFMIGHITKDGNIAGPKILEHMVDTVLQFEGDRHYVYRLLRTTKNRFGSTSELGIYEMNEGGMRPVANPSEILISEKDELLSGSAIAASLEGMRPLLIEVQALVTQSVYGTPQRTVIGFDQRRLQLLLAILEKRGGFQFGSRDVFVNIAGGIKVEDPGIDLAMVVALLSSYEDVPLPHNISFAGEVGLNGEIRPVQRVEQRVAEAAKLGFEKILVPKNNARSLGRNPGIEVIPVARVDEAYRLIF